jgi:hypothetical protein
MAAALGADEYGFGTAALVALGCVMARQCHANTCPVGIATQREDLRAGFAGTADMLVGYLKLIAGEVREILASLGLIRLEDLIGRADLLRRRPGIVPSISLDSLLARATAERPLAPNVERSPNGERVRNGAQIVRPRSDFDRARSSPVGDRRHRQYRPAFGAGLPAPSRPFGDRGLKDGSVQLAMIGSAGRAGVRLRCGCRSSAMPTTAPAGHARRWSRWPRARGAVVRTRCGGQSAHGATGGRLFAGLARRFGIRNSGATTVVGSAISAA